MPAKPNERYRFRARSDFPSWPVFPLKKKGYSGVNDPLINKTITAK